MVAMMKRIATFSFVSALLAVTLSPAGTAVAGSSPRFLTLPFPQTSGMRIEDGFLRGAGDVHGGVDYINGRVGRPGTWQTFPVIAAAGGRACAARSRVAGCGADGISNGIGNRVVIDTAATVASGTPTTGISRTSLPAWPLARIRT